MCRVFKMDVSCQFVMQKLKACCGDRIDLVHVKGRILSNTAERKEKRPSHNRLVSQKESIRCVGCFLPGEILCHFQ